MRISRSQEKSREKLGKGKEDSVECLRRVLFGLLGDGNRVDGTGEGV